MKVTLRTNHNIHISAYFKISFAFFHSSSFVSDDKLENVLLFEVETSWSLVFSWGMSNKSTFNTDINEKILFCKMEFLIKRFLNRAFIFFTFSVDIYESSKCYQYKKSYRV